MDSIDIDTTISARAQYLELDIDGPPTPVIEDPAPVGSSRILDLDDGRTADTVPVAVPVPSRRSGQRVSVEGAERARRDEDTARAHGFTPRAPIYEIGTEVVDLGVENFRASRSAYEAMPRVEVAAAQVADLVFQERRQDLAVALPATMLRADGRLAVRHADGENVFPLSEPGFRDYVRHVTGSGGTFLSACRSDLRAQIMGHEQWRDACYRLDSRASEEAGEPVLVPRQVIVRTRRRDANREVWSVVGSRYRAHDVDQVAVQLARIFEGDPDARMTATYDGYRCRFEVLYHSNIEPERAVAGEFFKAGIVINTADDGSGSIKVSAVVWRNLCLNLIVVDRATQVTGNQRHIGNAVADGVKKGIQRARAKIEDFAGVWSSASAENVLERYSDYVSDVDEIFEALVKSRVVHVAGVRPDDMVERLKRAWERDPGYSKASVINAITRAAHTETWRSMDAMEDLETQAGQLLYQRVWRLPEIRA